MARRRAGVESQVKNEVRLRYLGAVRQQQPVATPDLDVGPVAASHVRATLAELEHEGLVDSSPGAKGARVWRLSPAGTVVADVGAKTLTARRTLLTAASAAVGDLLGREVPPFALSAVVAALVQR